ncbi:1-pyrroline-5-carboxylate dehydrogenase, partial [Cryomyces antarcticus]
MAVKSSRPLLLLTRASPTFPKTSRQLFPALYAGSARNNMATMANFKVPKVDNEPNKHYTKGSPERQKLADAVEALKRNAPVDVPLVVGGKE